MGLTPIFPGFLRQQIARRAVLAARRYPAKPLKGCVDVVLRVANRSGFML
jgi:hypothetical protein